MGGHRRRPWQEADSKPRPAPCVLWRTTGAKALFWAAAFFAREVHPFRTGYILQPVLMGFCFSLSYFFFLMFSVYFFFLMFSVYFFSLVFSIYLLVSAGG